MQKHKKLKTFCKRKLNELFQNGESKLNGDKCVTSAGALFMGPASRRIMNWWLYDRQEEMTFRRFFLHSTSLFGFMIAPDRQIKYWSLNSTELLQDVERTEEIMNSSA